jgi:hypothetical protein
MEDKKTKEKTNDVADDQEQKNENQDQEIGNENETVKVSLKNQKQDGKENAEDWKKIDSIVGAAKEVYKSGESTFQDVVESMIATLQDLLESEMSANGLGGLYGGPKMDIPAEPEPDQQDENQQEQEK